MKIFEIWRRVNRYFVLKCPYCKHVFRWDATRLKVFEKDVKNVTCHKCNEKVPIEANCLDNDPLDIVLDGYLLRKEIVNGKEVKEENPLKSGSTTNLDFTSAAEL